MLRRPGSPRKDDDLGVGPVRTENPASRAEKRWIKLNIDVYKNTGKLFEKNDVTDTITRVEVWKTGSLKVNCYQKYL
jgi:hypothetical protein